jgi:hypothetical protein
MDDFVDGLIYLGHMAVFYLPVQKLDSIEYGENGQTPREMLHQFLMEHYDAYTMEISDTQGFWRMNQRSQIFVDKNARYEVSFEGRQRIREFVAFLSHRFPDATALDVFEFEYSHVTKDSKLGQCLLCGVLTRWIDVKLQKHVCSEECCGKVWQAYNEEAEKVFQHEKVEVYRSHVEQELALALTSRPAWKDIIIVVRDQLAYLKTCIESIQEHTKNYSLYIWDNGSGPETQEYLDNLRRKQTDEDSVGWDIEIWRSENNLGFIRPNNDLAAVGKGEYIIPLNSDTKVFQHWDTAMIGFLQQHPDVAQVGYWGGHMGPDGRGFGGDNGYEVDYIPGWCFCVSRETYNQFGLFSKQLDFAYCEDADLSLRLKEAGKSIYALHAPLVYHFQNKTIQAVEKEGVVDVRATFERNHKYIQNRWKDYLENKRVLLNRRKDSSNV